MIVGVDFGAPQWARDERRKIIADAAHSTGWRSYRIDASGLNARLLANAALLSVILAAGGSNMANKGQRRDSRAARPSAGEDPIPVRVEWNTMMKKALLEARAQTKLSANQGKKCPKIQEGRLFSIAIEAQSFARYGE